MGTGWHGYSLACVQSGITQVVLPCTSEILEAQKFLKTIFPPFSNIEKTPSSEEKIGVLSHHLRNFLWEEIHMEADFSGTYGDFYHSQSCPK